MGVVALMAQCHGLVAESRLKATEGVRASGWCERAEKIQNRRNENEAGSGTDTWRWGA